VVRCLRPPFRLAKFEGDAAFFYAVTDKVDGSLLQDAIHRQDRQMGVRCGRRRRQRCALMKAKQRLPALRSGQPDDLASNRGSCDRISLRRASMRRKITLNNPGIWGMSDKSIRTRGRTQR
jgi:hypothetical protein